MYPLEHFNVFQLISSDVHSKEGRKEMFYLTTHSTHFIYGYMASDIWLRTILIVRKETRCRHIGYSYRLTARVLYMHHPTDRIIHTTAFVTLVVEHWLEREIAQWVARFEYIVYNLYILGQNKSYAPRGHLKLTYRRDSIKRLYPLEHLNIFQLITFDVHS